MDIYFIRGEGRVDPTFRITGRQPELWDPVTGRIEEALCYRSTSEGRTVVSVNLPADGSLFVVFRKPARGPHMTSAARPAEGIEIAGRTQKGVHLRLWRPVQYVLTDAANRGHAIKAPPLPEPLTLGGPWEVRFDPQWGGPKRVVFQQLIPWNEHPETSIRYYSGTATYRQVLELEEAATGGLVRLDLGKVCNVARVRLNGQDLGVVWTAPWRKDLTKWVRVGKNALEIDVTNVWANRLIGDAALPQNKRLTRTNVGLFATRAKRPAWQGYAADDPLLPSGLIGPVRIEFGRGQEIQLE
jgi:hypothetical protein